MSAIHLPQQRPASGPASATAAPAGDPGWSRVLLVAGSRAALAVVLSLVVWSVLPAALGWSPRVIMSGSMEPRIHVGDVVVDRPVDASTLTEGRIITVTDPDHPEKTRTHRFQQRDEAGRLVTRGDANEAADSTPVDPDDVLGVAAIRVPYVGLPVTWLAQGQLAPVGIAVTVLLLLGLAATTPLRLAAGAAGADEPDEPGDGPDDTDDDAGLGILDPAAAARRRERLRAAAPRRGGRVATRSDGRGVRRLGIGGTVVGAVLAMLATTGTTYAAFSQPTPNPTSRFTSAALFRALDYAGVVRGDAPQFHWRLDEGRGNRAADAVGNRGATVQGGNWGWPQGALLGDPSATGLSVDGAELIADVQTSSGSTFSIEVWMRTTRTSGGPLLALTNTNGSGVDRGLYLGNDGKARFGRLGTQRVASGAALNDGDWHHVVYTNASSGTASVRGKLYVDGQLASQGSVVNATVDGFWDAGSVTWGRTWGGNPDQFFRGDLDELAVYTDVLTPTEVTEHYTESGR